LWPSEGRMFQAAGTMSAKAGGFEEWQDGHCAWSVSEKRGGRIGMRSGRKQKGTRFIGPGGPLP
jgi:hypothetical protein